jgi:uncharacterized coiled-coil DUF342 family protein
MTDLKPCPFCGNIGNPHKEDCYFTIQNRPEYPSLYITEGWDAWNTRPIEDDLRKHGEDYRGERDAYMKSYDGVRKESDALRARINEIQSCSNPDDYMKVDDIIEALKAERDAFQAKLDMALKELDYLESRTDEYVKASIIKTLEEINRIG